MGCVTVRAREAAFQYGSFRLCAGDASRIELHGSRDMDPGTDGRALVDGGRVDRFEFLGRTRLANGSAVALVRVGGTTGRTFAFDARLNGRAPAAGNIRVGFDELDAGLPLDLPWLVAGTRVSTPRGLRPVEDLRPGDLVITRDDGPQPVRHAVRRNVGAQSIADDREARPAVILAGSFAPGVPARDLRLSRRARVLLCGWRADRTSAYSGVLAPAGTLIDRSGVVPDMGSSGATLVHLVLDGHGVILAEGLGVELGRPAAGEPIGYRMVQEWELAHMGVCVHAAPLAEIGSPARVGLTRWELSAIERERRQGTWADALRLITVEGLAAAPAPGSGTGSPIRVAAGHPAEPLLLRRPLVNVAG